MIKWFKIKKKKRIDKDNEMQVENNPVRWLCHNIYDNKQQMLHLKNKKEVRLFEIIEIEGTEIKRVFKIILKKYDNMVLKETYNIGNC